MQSFELFGRECGKWVVFLLALLMNVFVRLKEQPMVIDVLLGKSELIYWLILINGPELG